MPLREAQTSLPPDVFLATGVSSFMCWNTYNFVISFKIVKKALPVFHVFLKGSLIGMTLRTSGTCKWKECERDLPAPWLAFSIWRNSSKWRHEDMPTSPLKEESSVGVGKGQWAAVRSALAELGITHTHLLGSVLSLPPKAKRTCPASGGPLTHQGLFSCCCPWAGGG